MRSYLLLLSDFRFLITELIINNRNSDWTVNLFEFKWAESTYFSLPPVSIRRLSGTPLLPLLSFLLVFLSPSLLSFKPLPLLSSLRTVDRELLLVAPMIHSNVIRFIPCDLSLLSSFAPLPAALGPPSSAALAYLPLPSPFSHPPFASRPELASHLPPFKQCQFCHFIWHSDYKETRR